MIRVATYLLIIGLIVFNWLKFIFAMALGLVATGMVHRFFKNRSATYLVASVTLLCSIYCLVNLDIYGVQKNVRTSLSGILYEFSHGKWDGDLRESRIEFPNNHSSGILWMSSEYSNRQMLGCNKAHRIDTVMYKKNMPSGILWTQKEFSVTGEPHGRHVIHFFYPSGKTETEYFIDGKPVSKSNWESQICGN